MSSLKDKTCYLRNAKRKLNKNAGRYDNFIDLKNVENRKMQVVNFSKEIKKKGNFWVQGITIFLHLFSIQFDCGRFVFGFEF